MNRAEGEPKMPTIEPDELPTKEDGTLDPAAMRREKDARLRKLEAEPHPLDRRDGPSPEVERVVNPDPIER
jgi:hypothetical protein